MIAHGDILWLSLSLMVPLFIGALVGIGTSLFKGVVGMFGGDKAPIEEYDIIPPPAVPVKPSDLLVGAGLIGLGVYLFIKR